MKHLNQSLDQFAEAIVQGEPVTVNPLGQWHIEGYVKRAFSKIFHLEEKRMREIAGALINSFDHFEKIPVQFHPQKSFYEEFQPQFHAAEALFDAMSICQSKEAKQTLNQLKRRYIALKYRIEEVNGGLDPIDIQEDLFNELKCKAYHWKKNQHIFFIKELTEYDLEKLRDVSRYAEFSELLLDDQELLQQFFDWIFRDKNSVRPFIEFPANQLKLVDCCLSSRIGRIGGELLHVVKEKVDDSSCQKILTLPFEGKLMSILDDQKVIKFRGNYELTLEDVFIIFKNKFARVGNFEFLAQGIVNWNDHHLGWWDADLDDFHRIDLDCLKWWEQMPIFEIISKEKAQTRYGWQLDGIHWCAAAYASRSYPTLDVDKNHAYLEVAVPLSAGRYAIYDFGKFAYEFPTTFFENLSIFCRNVHATIAFPDENVFYSHRQHANHSFRLSHQEGLKLMDRIKRDIIRSRGYNFVFQIESENCAKWVHETLEHALGKHRMPDLFRIPLLNTEPMGLVGQIFGLIKKLPPKMQITALTTLHLPFGASKGTWVHEDGRKVLKSLTKHHFWKTTEIYLPAVLINQKQGQ